VAGAAGAADCTATAGGGGVAGFASDAFASDAFASGAFGVIGSSDAFGAAGRSAVGAAVAAIGGFCTAIAGGGAIKGFSDTDGGMTAALGETISPAGFGDGPVSRPTIGNGLAVAFSRAGAAASFLTMLTT
jgi:hypothetical protein